MVVEILKLDNQGRGIGYANDKITFVFNALPEELVDIKLTKQTKKYNEGEVIKYLKMSKERVEPLCPYFSKCGGCNLEHLSYEATCNFKRETLTKVLQKFADLSLDVHFISSSNPYHYRNKLSLKAFKGEVGFYAEETHSFIPIKHCYLAKESINKVFSDLKILEGDILIRSNYNDEIIIDITTSSKVEIDIPKLTKDNKIIGIIVNNKVIYGEDHFMERVNHMLFQVHSKSFFQVNLDVATKALDLIKENVSREDNVLDLYCGVGFLGLSVAKKVRTVYGVEVIPSAIKDALLNAKINKIDNAKFFLGKSENILVNIPNDINTVIVDPPREGLKKGVVDYLLAKQNIKKIIYMSCDMFSLARDLKLLKTKYKVQKVYGLDMFPYTKHVESLIILTK